MRENEEFGEEVCYKFVGDQLYSVLQQSKLPKPKESSLKSKVDKQLLPSKLTKETVSKMAEIEE